MTHNSETELIAEYRDTYARVNGRQAPSIVFNDGRFVFDYLGGLRSDYRHSEVALMRQTLERRVPPPSVLTSTQAQLVQARTSRNWKARVSTPAIARGSRRCRSFLSGLFSQIFLLISAIGSSNVRSQNEMYDYL